MNIKISDIIFRVVKKSFGKCRTFAVLKVYKEYTKTSRLSGTTRIKNQINIFLFSHYKLAITDMLLQRINFYFDSSGNKNNIYCYINVNCFKWLVNSCSLKITLLTSYNYISILAFKVRTGCYSIGPNLLGNVETEIVESQFFQGYWLILFNQLRDLLSTSNSYFHLYDYKSVLISKMVNHS